jgi:hypothetical protein
MTMRILSLLAGVCLMAATLAAAEVDGKWEATVQSPRGEQQYAFMFKADGETLTGTVNGGRGGEAAIEDGKIQGDAISFKQNLSFGDRSITFVYSGKVSGDSSEMTRKAEGGPGGGPGREATFTATRAK